MPLVDELRALKQVLSLDLGAKMQVGDSKGYYARLNLTNTATAAEIKSSFRRLAKETHPDSGTASDGGARFRAISEAYAILSDPHARARYDSASATEPERTAARVRIDPICCSVCAKVTAQPRYIVFRNVVSVILVTMRNPIQGIYCSSCARTVAFKATFLSAVVGWWGVPWGPIFTVFEGLRNAVGGDNLEGNEDRLLWHNAIAFAQRGDHKLALGLAQRVEFSSDPGIAEAAAKLIDFLRSHGLSDSGKLKSPWAFRPLDFLAHLLLISIVPGILAIVITLSERGASRPPLDYTATPQYAPVEAPSPVPTAPTAEAAPQAPTCAHPPATGSRLAGRRLAGPGHKLEIDNGSGGDAIIKIRNAETGRLLTSFFVAQSSSAAIEGIPDGRYLIQYAFGPSLAEDCRSFTTISSASQFPQVETLTTEEREEALGTRIIRQRLSYTLYAVPYGNTQPVDLDPTSFNRD